MLHETVDNSSLIDKSNTNYNDNKSIDNDLDSDVLERQYVACPICFENIENSNSENQDTWDAMIFKCKHYVCTSCSIEMIIRNTFKKCPLCRDKIVLDARYNGIITLIQTYNKFTDPLSNHSTIQNNDLSINNHNDGDNHDGDDHDGDDHDGGDHDGDDHDGDDHDGDDHDGCDHDIESQTVRAIRMQNLYSGVNRFHQSIRYNRDYDNRRYDNYHETGNAAHHNNRDDCDDRDDRRYHGNRDEHEEFECDRDFGKCCSQLACSMFGIGLLYIFFLSA